MGEACAADPERLHGAVIRAWFAVRILVAPGDGGRHGELRLYARPMHLRIALVFVLAVVLLGCGGGPDTSVAEPAPQASPTTSQDEDAAPATPEQPTEAPDPAYAVTLRGPDGQEAAFRVEVVADPPGRQQGLMHRTELAADAGMLFLFPDDRAGGFWMKDTLIPLSIAFMAADGEVLAILDMEPCEADPCPTYDPGVTYRTALEVNQGAFDDAGVDTGWHAGLPDDLPPPS
jgi:uncharacterized protein